MPNSVPRTYSVPFGRGSISFTLPDGVDGRIARSRSVTPLPDPIAAARDAVRSPLGTAPLRELASGKRTRLHRGDRCDS